MVLWLDRAKRRRFSFSDVCMRGGAHRLFAPATSESTTESPGWRRPSHQTHGKHAGHWTKAKPKCFGFRISSLQVVTWQNAWSRCRCTHKHLIHSTIWPSYWKDMVSAKWNTIITALKWNSAASFQCSASRDPTWPDIYLVMWLRVAFKDLRLALKRRATRLINLSWMTWTWTCFQRRLWEEAVQVVLKEKFMLQTFHHLFPAFSEQLRSSSRLRLTLTVSLTCPTSLPWPWVS